MFTAERICKIMDSLASKSIGLIGDFCVDIYWHADMTRSELSRETPHYPLPVTQERVYLGAAGNVAANIAALSPARLCAMSLYSHDWRGMLMLDELKKAGIDSGFFVECENRFTNAYCKPMRKGISTLVYEDPRLDFDNYEPISAKTEEQIIVNLRKMAECTDIICVADQFRFGIVTKRVRDEIIALAKAGHTVVADSRYCIAEYSNCILKPNEVECWRAVYSNEDYLNADIPAFTAAADKLAVKNNASVFCTLGANGSYVTSGENGTKIGAVKLQGELDICGAGDTSLSAFVCALAAGCNMSEAAQLACLASAVTVQKIGMTGTASFEEISSLLER